MGSPVSTSSVSRVVGFWSNILIYVGRAIRPGKVENRHLLLKETIEFFFFCEWKVPLKFLFHVISRRALDILEFNPVDTDQFLRYITIEVESVEF